MYLIQFENWPAFPLYIIPYFQFSEYSMEGLPKKHIFFMKGERNEKPEYAVPSLQAPGKLLDGEATEGAPVYFPNLIQTFNRWDSCYAHIGLFNLHSF